MCFQYKLCKFPRRYDTEYNITVAFTLFANKYYYRNNVINMRTKYVNFELK